MTPNASRWIIGINCYSNTWMKSARNLTLYNLLTSLLGKRIVNNLEKKSILDHVYVKDPNHIRNIEMHLPLFGDHNLITFEIPEKNIITSLILRRNWSSYTKEKLVNALLLEPFNIETDSVQQTWNLFENTLLNIIEILAPLEKVIANDKHSKVQSSSNIKRLLR